MTNLTELCKDMEAFETARWAVEAILDVEMTTPVVFDPCVGTGIIPAVCRDRGLTVDGIDKVDWRTILPFEAMKWRGFTVQDFFDFGMPLRDVTVMMNPPFSRACQFVDHARRMGARKIICFQRQAWRESDERRVWWEENPPSRVWVCGARATCWRFDLLQCQHTGEGVCPNRNKRGKKLEQQGCSQCMGGVPTSHAWYVWERGHKGAEVTGAIYPTTNSKEKIDGKVIG